LRTSAHSIRRRRWHTFKANRRGYLSAIILLVLFALSLFAELLANDKPLLVSYKGELLVPSLPPTPKKTRSAACWKARPITTTRGWFE
jgi:ABC-type microcin C transport system permease subunit YejE